MSAVIQALDSLKVVEFGGYAAGPHIGKILANFGATVIHVESADRPDGFRLQYPPFRGNRPGVDRGACFSYFNDSKLGVTIDLKKPGGVELARRLTAWCDLVIENMRPGVMDRLGLGHARLAEDNPGLVMLSTCNMGQTGPRADTPGFGSQLSALAGMCGLTGQSDGPPMLLYGPYIDFIASSLGTSAALAALVRRRDEGRGAYIDVSQYECGLMFMAGALQDYFSTGTVAERRGNDDDGAAPHGVYPCTGDGWLALSCWSDDQFAALAGAIGRAALAADPRFVTLGGRIANRAALDEIIARWTRARQADDAAEFLQEAMVEAHAVSPVSALFEDPQLAARRTWRRRHHAEIGDQAYCFPAFDLAATPGDVTAAAPRLGGDNEFVFRDLMGLTEVEYEDYRTRGVFG